MPREVEALAIEDLSLRLGRRGPRLLRGVTLEVRAGEVHGLVGESGAGKSMIGKAVLGLLPPEVRQVAGDVRVHGASLADLTPRARRQLIGARTGVIPQDPLSALNPSRRIGGQITDRLVRSLGWRPRDAVRRAQELLAEVAIDSPERVMRAYPHELSGGMRQRVLIAAAFAAEPELIVADEPTTALDATVQKQILRLIAQMQARHGTALLFVTHDMGVVAQLCQRVSVLFQGHVVAQQPVSALFGGYAAHPYAEALIAASPRHDRPEEALRPVPRDLIARMRQDIAALDAAWEARHA